MDFQAYPSKRNKNIKTNDAFRKVTRYAFAGKGRLT